MSQKFGDLSQELQNLIYTLSFTPNLCSTRGDKPTQDLNIAFNNFQYGDWTVEQFQSTVDNINRND